MIIRLPLTVTIPRKTKEDKVFALNLNVYRNAHHMVLNQSKILYKDLVKNALGGRQIVGEPPFTFSYTIHPANKRKFDLGNVGSVIDKFVCDSLVEIGVIKDDSYKFIGRVVFEIGAICPDDPHCELEII